MTNKEMLKQAKEGLKSSEGFINYHNFQIVDIKDKYCVMEAAITENSTNHVGYAHGGFIFGLADTAGGMAARTTGRNVVTINAHIDYLKPALGTKLKAVAEVVKDGKTIAVYEVKIYDDKEKEVARVGLSYFYID